MSGFILWGLRVEVIALPNSLLLLLLLLFLECSPIIPYCLAATPRRSPVVPQQGQTSDMMPEEANFPPFALHSAVSGVSAGRGPGSLEQERDAMIT